MEMTHVSQNSALPEHLKPLQEAVGKVVGITFFGEMLKSMRQSKINGTIGHGGRGEEIFAEQLHGFYAEQLGSATGKGQLGEAIFRHLAKQQTLIHQANSHPSIDANAPLVSVTK